jgi:hypothetical protein
MLGGAYVLPPAVGFILGVLLISFGHWLTELWLTWRAIHYRWLFIIGIIAAGSIAFIWSTPMERGIAIPASGFLLALYTCRLGLGFAHFVTDRWIWKMSDPAIRNALGSEWFPLIARRAA